METSLSNNHREIWSETASASSAAGVTTRMVTVREALIEAGRRIRRWAQRRADRRRFMQYPDHMLRDIGISRSEIDSALRHGRHGRPLDPDGAITSLAFRERQRESQSRRAA